MAKAANQLIAEYQDLLTENESLSAVQRVAKLVWDVLGGRIHLAETGFVFEPSTSKDRSVARQTQRATELQEVSDIEQWQALLGTHLPVGREHRRLRALVMEAGVVLKFVPAAASETTFSGSRYSLLMDSCLLLAHQAYFALLPKLDEPVLQHDREFLLSAFHQFADSLSEPADRFTLLALYFEATDEPHKAIESRRAALAATPADAHDFMTVLQTSWSSLVERKNIGDALDLLLDSYPRVPRRDLEEVGELIRQTFRHGIAAANGHSGRGEKRAGRRTD
jgi:hypothetical protein